MTGSRSVTVDRLDPDEVAARVARRPVAYLPLGSLEYHGPHLPIGLDALTAEGVCLGAADRGGGIVLPVLHRAVGGEHTRYPWTLMSAAPGPIEDQLFETMRRLDELGVRRFVILSGHFATEQRELVADLAAHWNATDARSDAIGRTLADPSDPPVAPDHAARFESLLLMALHPGLVDLDRLPSAEEFPAPRDEDPFGPDRHRPDHPLHGVFGPDPRGLDPDDAPGLLAHLVEWAESLSRL